MNVASRLLSVLFLLTLACTPEEVVRISPTPTAAPSTATAAASPTRTATPSPAPTTPAPTPSASPSATPTASPGGSPNPACAARTGGSTANRAVLSDVRIARHPGYDRLVFEFAPSTGPGVYGVPPFAVEVAQTFTATSGQPVRVDGNAFFLVRFTNADAHDQNGRVTVPSLDIKTPTPLIREVKIVEDFEASVRWAVGLDRLSCPTVLTLGGPVRVVVDFPNGT